MALLMNLLVEVNLFYTELYFKGKKVKHLSDDDIKILNKILSSILIFLIKM